MNLLTKLKSLAKEADEIYPNYELSSNAKSRFYNAANPETVLKLIEACEKMRDTLELMAGPIEIYNGMGERNQQVAAQSTMAKVRKLLESEP